MRIIIFDGSFRTTPFINRLVAGLAVNHEIYILGFNEKVDDKIKNVNYIKLGSNQNKIGFITTTLAFSFDKKSFSHFSKTLSLLYKKRRKDIQHQNFEIAISQIQPDIIHVQWPSLLPWCESFINNKKYKIVLSQRGSQINIAPFVDTGNLQYLRKLYPQVAGFHSVSKSISERGNSIWKDKTKIDKVVYTGLSFEHIVFSKNYSKSERLNLLSVGRAHWVKGYNYALKCCELLKDDKVSFQYTIIGGKGNEELQFLIFDLGLQDSVVLEGRMSQKKVFKKMQKASLLMIPSLEEGLPNVAVEAMALGLPVLSTDCGGANELIENNKSGWIVPPRNPEALANAIVDFMSLTQNEIEKIRLVARRKIEKQHSLDSMVIGMENLYQEILALN